MLLSGQSQSQTDLAIIPLPNHTEYYSGTYLLPKNINIGVDRLISESLKSILPSLVSNLTVDNIVDLENVNELVHVFLVIDKDIEKNEAYEVTVNNNGVRIVAGHEQGLFYGLQTFKQLADNASLSTGCEIPQLKITDEPRFSYRGLHLDVSRHFFSVDFIKRYLDLLALHKMNVFHWHLTDDQGWRIQIKSFPKLTRVGSHRDKTVVGHTSNKNPEYDGTYHGGFYTHEDIREVVSYAQHRHINVIPEIDIPGHASALLAAYPEYACVNKTFEVQSRFGIFTDVLCPKPSSFRFIESVLAEVADLFPSEYIHIGGDEVKKTQWQQCECCSALMKEHDNDLHSYFVKRVEAIANQLGKKIIGWDELLDGNVNKTTAIMTWRGIEAGQKAASLGHDVVMSPVGALYFDFYQSSSVDEPMSIHGLTPLKTVYDYDPVPAGLDDAAQSHILGAQANVWTEYLSTEVRVEEMILPRMTALSELLWTRPDKKSFPSFISRLETFLPNLQGLGYTISDAYKNVMSETAVIGSAVELSLTTDLDDMVIYYNSVGDKPTANDSVYRETLRIIEPTTIMASAFDDKNQRMHGLEVISVVPHKALNKPISFRHEPDTSTNSLKGQLLLNGVLATNRVFQFHEWAGFDEKGMDAIIDLQQELFVSSVELGYQAGIYRRLYSPTKISIYKVDEDGVESLLATVDKTAIEKSSPRINLPFASQSVQYLRVVAENDNVDYSAEERAEITMPIYIDEIIVN